MQPDMSGQMLTIFQMKYNKKFPLAPMGTLAPMSAHSRPSAQAPIETRGHFSGGEGQKNETFSDHSSRHFRRF